MTREKMPNFFSVIDEMAKRFIELMQSDYRLKRKTTTGAGRSLTTKSQRLNWLLFTFVPLVGIRLALWRCLN